MAICWKLPHDNLQCALHDLLGSPYKDSWDCSEKAVGSFPTKLQYESTTPCSRVQNLYKMANHRRLALLLMEGKLECESADLQHQLPSISYPDNALLSETHLLVNLSLLSQLRADASAKSLVCQSLRTKER